MASKKLLAVVTNETLTGNGSAGALDVLDADAVEIIVDCSSASGTSPSLQFTLSYIDPNTAAVVAIPGVSFTAITAALTTPQRVVVDPLYAEYVVLAWTVTGTTPSFGGVSVTFNLINRSPRP